MMILNGGRKFTVFDHDNKALPAIKKHGGQKINFNPTYLDEETERIMRKDEPVIFDADVLLFCDSNGISISEKGLHKKYACKKFFCPTYCDIVDAMNKGNIVQQPNRIFVHAGTADFNDGDTGYVTHNIDILFDTLVKKFPDSIVCISSVLPRKRFDPLTREVRVLNRHLEEKCGGLAKFSFMDNNENISNNLLRDCVHLNDAGVQRLVSNIKFYLFGQIEFPKGNEVKTIPPKLAMRLRISARPAKRSGI